jgi:hypothetical protein
MTEESMTVVSVAMPIQVGRGGRSGKNQQGRGRENQLRGSS